MSDETPIEPAALASKIVALLDSASFDTTYKLATLEAIILAVADNLDASGRPPSTLSARDISNRVLQRYWSQAVPFTTSDGETIDHLRQRRAQGGDLISHIAKVRVDLDLTSRAHSLTRATSIDEKTVRKLEEETWRRVVDMPIPRLQRMGSDSGGVEDRFLFDYSWGDKGKKNHVSLAREDDTLFLKPGVAEGLLLLQPLLLRHIETLWVTKVAAWNPAVSDASRLHESLFGSDRLNTKALVEPLSELQNGQCFYCSTTTKKAPHVDHFLPWSLGHNESVENMVLSCEKCNLSKSATLADVPHLSKWLDRMNSGSEESTVLEEIASSVIRPHHPDITKSQARASYLYLPASSLLWLGVDSYVSLDGQSLSAVLTNS